MSKDWLLNDPVVIFAPERKQKRALDSKTRTTTSTRFSQYKVVLLREPRHFGGKRDSRRHSTTSFSENVVVAGTSYQILEV